MNIVRSVASGIRPLASLAVTLVACATLAAQFQHDLKGDVKPWTNEGFLDDPPEFHFAVTYYLQGPDPVVGKMDRIFLEKINILYYVLL